MRRKARESLDRIYENFATLRNAMAEPQRDEANIRSAEAAIQAMALVAIAEALTEINETLDKSIYPAIAERGS